MKTIYSEVIDLKEVHEAMGKADAFNKPGNILRNIVDAFSTRLIAKAELKPIVNTIAFQTFSAWAIEFFKNVVVNPTVKVLDPDVDATELAFEFKFDEKNQQVEIVIRDNGKNPVPSYDKYRWETPFETASSKLSRTMEGSVQMGGAHLGLARFAHVLEKYCDNGKITLIPREDQPGAEITLKGSATSWERDVQDEKFNEDYMREMNADLPKAGATSATTRVTKHLMEDVSGLGRFSSNDPSPELLSPPSIRGKKTPSSTTIQTPTIQPWSPVSPYIAEQPSKHVDPNAEQPSKHTDPNAELPHTQSFNLFSPKKREKKNLTHPSPIKPPEPKSPK